MITIHSKLKVEKLMNLTSHIAEIFRTFLSRHQQAITKIRLYLLDVAIIISYTKSLGVLLLKYL